MLKRGRDRKKMKMKKMNSAEATFTIKIQETILFVITKAQCVLLIFSIKSFFLLRNCFVVFWNIKKRIITIPTKQNNCTNLICLWHFAWEVLPKLTRICVFFVALSFHSYGFIKNIYIFPNMLANSIWWISFALNLKLLLKITTATNKVARAHL